MIVIIYNKKNEDTNTISHSEKSKEEKEGHRGRY